MNEPLNVAGAPAVGCSALLACILLSCGWWFRPYLENLAFVYFLDALSAYYMFRSKLFYFAAKLCRIISIFLKGFFKLVEQFDNFFIHKRVGLKANVQSSGTRDQRT